MLRYFLRQTLVTLMLLTPALAASPAEQRGKTFALTNCARCHSIDRITQSPLKIAPPFRSLHNRYPVETLAEALAEGINTGHPTMPEFQLEPDQIHDLLSYMKSLE
ncbi:MAG TPA: cytochrome c [Pseudolabrys sp.]|nr:cytochrome c [Pseudolabrys sp.]